MALTGLPSATAREALHEHLGVCLDLCHAAVEFEDAAGCLQQLRDATSACTRCRSAPGLRVPGVDARTEALLRPFDDPVYLHQVVEREPTVSTRYLDLPDAFATLPERRDEREWRVHCHVPVFLDDMGAVCVHAVASSAMRWPRIANSRSRSISKSRPTPGACCPSGIAAPRWITPSRAS